MSFQQDKSAVEHLHRYAIAAQYSNEKIVLDIASGEGYGTNLLGKTAKFVFGIDISKDAISYSKSKYKSQNIQFTEGSTTDIPLDNESIDVIVSFETLEHLADHEKMIMEFKRVLKPNGLLIISTPDKEHYSDIKQYKNPFHVKELYTNEFYDLIKRFFKNSELYKQGVIKGSIIYNNETSPVESFSVYKGNFSEITKHGHILVPEYNLIFASNCELGRSHLSLLDSPYFDYELNSLKEELENTKRTFEAQISSLTNSASYRLGNLLVRCLNWTYEIFKVKWKKTH